MSNEEALFKIIELMRRLERDLAVLYMTMSNGIHDNTISSLMRKIGLESATHSYLLTLVKSLMRGCLPRNITDLETLSSMQGDIEESLTHVHELMDFVNSKSKVSEDLTGVVIEKLSEFEGFESKATRMYSFLIRSYLPITSTKTDLRRRATSKLIVKLLKGISDDEKEHQELLTLVSELLRSEKA